MFIGLFYAAAFAGAVLIALFRGLFRLIVKRRGPAKLPIATGSTSINLGVQQKEITLSKASDDQEKPRDTNDPLSDIFAALHTARDGSRSIDDRLTAYVQVISLLHGSGGLMSSPSDKDMAVRIEKQVLPEYHRLQEVFYSSDSPSSSPESTTV